jgi:Flp pilus assembly protein TadG
MRRLTEETGAIAVLTAMLLVVLCGLGALVVDVGAAYVEGRQLQNGADAAALAIAQSCAAGSCGSGSAGATASSLANLNSNDGASGATVQLPGTGGPGTVTVTTTTLTAGGETVLANRLAGALGLADRGVRRSATATWGTFAGGTTLPVAMCARVWGTRTSNGTVLPSGPPSYILGYAGGGKPSDAICGNPGSTDTYPGGFGYLLRDGDCRISVSVDAAGTWVDGTTGSPTDPGSGACKSVDAIRSKLDRIIAGTDPLAPGSVALVPIFDSYRSSGSAGQFRVRGYGAFKLEGYEIQSKTGGSMGAKECSDFLKSVGGSGSGDCMKGYFTHFVSADALAILPGGISYGASGFRLTQ